MNYLYKNIALYPSNFEEVVNETSEEKIEEVLYNYKELFSKELFRTINMNLRMLDKHTNKVNKEIVNYLYGWLIFINKYDS